MKSQSSFVYTNTRNSPGLGNFLLPTAIVNYFFGSESNLDELRGELSRAGFLWIRKPSGQPWNIDGWSLRSLENIKKAYREYGSIVAQLHNQGAFNDWTTQKYSLIEKIVEKHTKPEISTPTPKPKPSTSTPSNPTPSQTSFDYSNQYKPTAKTKQEYPWLLPASLALGVISLLLVRK